MKLQEYQAREIFKKYKIPVPEGSVCTSPEEAREIAQSLGKSVVIKAQVQVGGRGKAGGVKLAHTPDAAEKIARDILSSTIKGIPVKNILVVSALEISKEYYLSCAIDRDTKQIVVIASSVGGVDIESVAENTPQMISKIYLDNLSKIHNFQARKLCFNASFDKKYLRDISGIIISMYKILVDLDALLVEINPVIITSDERVYAGDSKIIIDDNALYRQSEFKDISHNEEEHFLEREAKKRSLPYVKLQGNIGIIGNGAGLVMTTMDLVEKFGGRPANFLDFGAGAKSDVIKSSVELVLMDKDVDGILMNIFGGLTRGDEVAKGIIEVFQNMDIKIPIVIRLAGNRAEEGLKLLESANLNLISAPSLIDAAKKVVEITQII